MSANFQKLLSRKHAVLTDSIILSAWNDQERFSRLTGFPEYVQNLEIVDGDFCFDLDWMTGITKKYSAAPEDIFRRFVNGGYQHGEVVRNYARNLDVDSLVTEQLEVVFDTSVDLLKNLLVFLPITHPLAKVVEQKLTKILIAKGIAGEQMNDALLELTKPDKLNTPAQEVADLRLIKSKIGMTGFDVEASLAEHVKSYGVLGYREPFSKGYDVNFFRERLDDLGEEGGSSRQFNLEFNDEELAVIKLMRELVYFRNYRTEKLYEALYYLEPLWLALGRKYQLTKAEDLAYYTLQEVAKLLSQNEKISSEIISERKVGHAYLLHDNKLQLIVGADLLGKKALAEKVDLNIKEIKGSIACRGKIIGPAKLVLRASEQGKINDGDVLVTSMTTPDFIPCMKKAAAFVTDEGGITCHAAIVAREMNKPCIIGTKVATKVLKDGDVVEVDAERGVVTMIERGNNSAVEETDKPAIGPEHVEGQDNGVVRVIK